MWEQSLIETKPGHVKRSIGVQLSILFHVAVVGSIICSSYWYIETVKQRLPIINVFYKPGLPPSSPPEFGQGGSARSHARLSITRSAPVVSAKSLSNPNALVTNTQLPAFSGADLAPAGPAAGVPDGVPGGIGIASLRSDSQGEDAPVILNPQISAPVLIRKVEPLYPQAAIHAHLEGVVVLQAIISKTGTVENLEVLRSSYPILEHAAVEAVKKWQYRPALLNHHPIKVYFTVTVQFKLHP